MPSAVVESTRVGTRLPSRAPLVLLEAVTETVGVSLRSTSAKAKEPLALSEPMSSPGSPSASSVSAPLTSVAAVTTGTSLEPVMVTATCWLTVPPLPSLTVRVKVSTTL